MLEYSPNYSVGRGAEAPFEMIGADFIHATELAAYLNQRWIPGARFYAVRFQPSSSHLAGTEIQGVRIEVTDTGIGIPSEALPRVFDRFFRVDPSRSQASGGTGLGLAIVQGIMLLHGGKVEIVSQPGKGTRVILSMPASAPTVTNV